MSVWTSIEALGAFTYSGRHREVLMRRREWFSRMREAFQVLWWVPDGVRPTVSDAEPAHGAEGRDERWFCPT